MKRIRFKKLCKPQKGIKALSCHQVTEDKECKTSICKQFAYRVSRIEEIISNAEGPQVYIRKFFDTKKNEEKFKLQVKGIFYIQENRFRFKVNLHHTLDIQIHWKIRVFSPKKSEVLT